MPFKFDSSGNIVTQGEGDKKLPVFVHADGREAPFDGDSTIATIGRLNGEAKSHREAKEALETRLRPFEGFDPAELEPARKALETIKNIDEGKLLTAGKVEEIKAAAKKAAEEQVAAASKAHAEKLALTQTELDRRTQELNSHIIGGGFSRTKLITDEKHPTRLAIPPDVAEAFFGRNFKVENGKAVGYDAAGNKIFSTTRPGEVADFDEALEAMVQSYPNKAAILRGSQASGSGAGNSGAGGGGGKKTITRANWQALPPAEQAAVARDHQIVS